MHGFSSIFHARFHRKNERNPVHSFYGLVHSFLRRCWFISKVLRLFRKIFAYFASYSAIIFDGLALGWYGDHEKAIEYATKLPNLYKTRETALVRILKDKTEKSRIAKSAIEPLAWLLSYHLTALSEAEDDPAYKDKIPKILDILFEGKENDFALGIRKKASK